MNDHEIQVLSEQLDELLASGVDDEDDALEVAAIAGMLQRLGAPREALADAEAWRTGDGEALLDDAWDEVDPDELVDAVESVSVNEATEEEVEEAVLDFDELVAAAIWCGRADKVAKAAREVEQTIRLVPEPFASLSPMGRDLARLPTVAAQRDLYAFWMAVADAAAFMEQ
jgi:hypothetical protein